MTSGGFCAGALLIVVASVGDAFAQNVVVFVNGEPITAIDIEQRSKFIQVTSQKAPPRQEVLDQLIDEKLKVREAKRWGMDIPNSEVDSSFATMASRMNMSSAQLTQSLQNRASMPARSRPASRRTLHGSNSSAAAISRDCIRPTGRCCRFWNRKSAEDRETVGYEYVMRPILFLVPPGSPDAIFQNRRKEAEALRGRFRGCEEGIPMVRAMRDVAVRDQVVRTSADLPDGLRKVLDSIPVGQLTAPEVDPARYRIVCDLHQARVQE